MSHDLDIAKRRLGEKLGNNYNAYIQLLGRWFRGFISKQEFDRSARSLIQQNSILEHNKFWLTFFQHCANTANGPLQATIYSSYNDLRLDTRLGCHASSSIGQMAREIPTNTKVRCLPNKVMTHMKIFVIVWEMGLDSINDQVSVYINLALQQFLKNLITEIICTKTAYRLRENRFKYAIGVKPMNPYLSNSLKVYTNNMEYDPYQIESNKMNSSLLDTCVYNDSLFPSRLYESQAVYEFACSTTSLSHSAQLRRRKRPKLLSEIFLNEGLDWQIEADVNDNESGGPVVKEIKLDKPICDKDKLMSHQEDGDESESREHSTDEQTDSAIRRGKKISMQHVMIAFLTNRTIIPTHALYSTNLERIFNKL